MFINMANSLILNDTYTRPIFVLLTQHEAQRTDTALSQTHNFIKKSLLYLKQTWDVTITGMIIFIITSLILKLILYTNYGYIHSW
jgi:hypothetical protein